MFQLSFELRIRLFVRVFCFCNQLSAGKRQEIVQMYISQLTFAAVYDTPQCRGHSRRLSGLETSALPQANAGDAAAGSGGAQGSKTLSQAPFHTPLRGPLDRSMGSQTLPVQ